MKRIIAPALLAVLTLAALAPAMAAPRVAVLTLDNRSGDPRYDYIGAIAGGILLYDLSSSGAVELVDRASIEALLAERELSLSAMATAPDRAFAGISSADYILAGEYALAGSELRLTLRLVDVASSRVSSFSDSGATENLVHGLAEAVVEKLTGRRPALRDEGRSRSILSLRDETPGSIALFSPLVDARVLLDGDFVGYTTGDRRVPFVLDGVEPGPHVVSTDLGRDFGVIGLPEVSFGPWKETVLVASGKKAIVTDKSSHFNDQLYRLRYVLDTSATAVFDSAGLWKGAFPFSYVDRTGASRSGTLVVELLAPSGQTNARVSCEFSGQAKSATFSYSRDSEAEAELAVGDALCSVSVESRGSRVVVEVTVERADVDQGMHRVDD